MSYDRQRVQEDLRGIVAGEVLCSEVIAQLYAADAGPFRIKPLGVVRPRQTQDVVAVVQYAAEHHIPLHARGAGTSCAAQSLGPGIVIDFSRFMRRVLSEAAESVTVEPGAIVGQLNKRLAKLDRTLGHEPWSNSVATVAGLLSVSAAGRYEGGFGRLRDQVLACEVVLADGSVVELGAHRLEPDLRTSAVPLVQRLVRRVAAILSDRHGYAPPPEPTDPRAALALRDVLGTDSINLAKLMGGAEGALGLLTWVRFKTLALPKSCGIVPLYFDRMESAAQAATLVRWHRPSACDLLDRRHLTVVREADPRYEMEIPPWAEAMLIVEKHADDDAAASEQLQQMAAEVVRGLEAATAGDVATHPADLAFYRYLAEAAPRLLDRIGGAKRPLHLADDLLIPPHRLAAFISAVQTLLQRQGVTASIYSHAGTGHVQLRPFLDLASADDRKHIEPLSHAIAETVWEHEGVLGSNAACAVVCGTRTPRSETSESDLLREVKRVFDDEGLLNPGKVVPTTPFKIDALLPALPPPAVSNGGGEQDWTPADGPPPEATAATSDALVADAAANGDFAALTVLSPDYGWSSGEVRAAAAKCSGCGVCRAEQDVRMCPINHIGPREEASPRAKAMLLRALLNGSSNGAPADDDEVKAVADLCVHCHMCRLECPAEVDIPRLSAEAKAQHVRTNGLTLSDWLMVHIDTVAAFSRRVRHLANWALGNQAARWLMEKGVGLARTRPLPTLQRRSFLEEARRRRLTVPVAGEEKVAFFVDTFANHFDVELGLALVAVLEHNGVMVWVPPTQKHAGMPMISRGALEPARDVARHNAGVLAEAVRQGYTIVATEPSAVLALTREYPALLPDDTDVPSVAEHAVEACQYLWHLHQRQRLRLDFKRLEATLGYHAPCHTLALRMGTPAENLMRLVPGLHVERLEFGCSGMAGTYGLQKQNYRNSLRAGLELMSAIRKTPLSAGATECSTCRIQMQHGTERPTVHPIKVLALAYGLMPELKRHLFSAGRELTLQ